MTANSFYIKCPYKYKYELVDWYRQYFDVSKYEASKLSKAALYAIWYRRRELDILEKLLSSIEAFGGRCGYDKIDNVSENRDKEGNLIWWCSEWDYVQNMYKAVYNEHEVMLDNNLLTKLCEKYNVINKKGEFNMGVSKHHRDGQSASEWKKASNRRRYNAKKDDETESGSKKGPVIAQAPRQHDIKRAGQTWWQRVKRRLSPK